MEKGGLVRTDCMTVRVKMSIVGTTTANRDAGHDMT